MTSLRCSLCSHQEGVNRIGAARTHLGARPEGRCATLAIRRKESRGGLGKRRKAEDEVKVHVSFYGGLYVDLASVNSGLVPLRARGEAADATAQENVETEERALLHVAATRARKSLTVLSFGRQSRFVVPT